MHEALERQIRHDLLDSNACSMFEQCGPSKRIASSGSHREDHGAKHALDTDMTVTYAAGGLYSTVNDLYKWVQGLESGKVMAASS